jgi:hypothetical protein
MTNHQAAPTDSAPAASRVDGPRKEIHVIRRTLALAGAATLALAASGLAGPAAADSGPGITTHDGVLINEIAAQLDSTGHSITGGFIELINPAEELDSVDISGWKVSFCTTGGEFEDAAVIQNNTVLAPGDTYLIGDFAYVPGAPSRAANQTFPSQNHVLEAAGGGVLLENGTGGVDDIMWGNPKDETTIDCVNFNPANATPDQDDSINRDSPWQLLSPTPTPL